MATKMIFEFYRMAELTPVAVILVFNCGEDPAAAALTVAGFIASVKEAIGTDSLEVGSLVSRFVLWEAEMSGSSISTRHIGTSFMEFAPKYVYQLVRLRVIGGSVHVEIVADQYSSEEELEEAAVILTAAQLPMTCTALV